MNAKKEFVAETKGKDIKCVKISNDGDFYPRDDRKFYILKMGYSKEDYFRFLNSLDFEYDDGFGGQELFGIIWYKDGSYCDRDEYDGAESWEHRSVPEIPEDLS